MCCTSVPARWQRVASSVGAIVCIAASNGGAALTSGEMVDVRTLARREAVDGIMADGGTDSREYWVWHKQDPSGGNAEESLVDDAGKPVYFVDPGINGSIRKLANGQDVPKFDAPKATLMSDIIKDILGGTLLRPASSTS